MKSGGDSCDFYAWVPAEKNRVASQVQCGWFLNFWAGALCNYHRVMPALLMTTDTDTDTDPGTTDDPWAVQKQNEFHFFYVIIVFLTALFVEFHASG